MQTATFQPDLEDHRQLQALHAHLTSAVQGTAVDSVLAALQVIEIQEAGGVDMGAMIQAAMNSDDDGVNGGGMAALLNAMCNNNHPTE
jgi:uncharacterized ferritin-like protein (DUF455 family)